jgi:hypothetical protein
MQLAFVSDTLWNPPRQLRALKRQGKNTRLATRALLAEFKRRKGNVSSLDFYGIGAHFEIISINKFNDSTVSITDNLVLDSERTFEQVLGDGCFDVRILSDQTFLAPSIAGNVKGFIDKHIRVEELGTDSYDDNKSVIGRPIKVVSDYDEDISAKLSYDCSSLAEIDEVFVRELAICELNDDGLSILDTKSAT